MAIVKPLPLTRLNFLFLGNHTVLLWARLGDVPPGSVALLLGLTPQELPIAYAQAGGDRYVLALLTHDALYPGAEAALELQRAGASLAAYHGPLEQGNALQRLLQWFGGMSQTEQAAFFGWLTGFAGGEKGLDETPYYRECCLTLLEQMAAPSFRAAQSFWLNPHLLYIEGEAEGAHPQGELRLLCLSGKALHAATAYYHRLSETRYALIARFKDAEVFSEGAAAQFLYLAGGWPVHIAGMRSGPVSFQELIRALNAKPPHEKRRLQEVLCRALLDSADDGAREELEALQCYLEFPPTHCANAQEPFNVHFEVIYPLGADGLFVCGWMRDPYAMLEGVEVNALGYRFALGGPMFRLKRPDVSEAFRASPHGGFEEDCGFVVYTPLPEAMRARMKAHGAALRALHFTVRLRGGMVHEIQPALHFCDARTARDAVLKMVPCAEVSEAMLEECLAPSIALLQSETMRAVGVRAVYEMEPQAEQPRVSVIIPLYKRLEYIKVQFATFAGDPAMRECEIIYVLDSPWQENEVRTLLREYAHLYRLPVKLVVMRHNSGYSAANNAGAAAARGEYLVLMNSDVFPAGKEWVTRMADFYEKKKHHIGALAPKLLYEDDSLQHAGMFFAKTTFADWLNLHYYKGYPRDYAPASISRPVPAVTGACLMISRELWNELDGLSTDYVVGDYEDSDLCLRCAEAGRENWYVAEAELYHLERQSVPLNDSYEGSLAWRYNARLHTRRWDGLIQRLMENYGDA